MAVDSNFNNVVLLLHCDGADAATTFTDSSPVPKTVTVNGNAQIDTAQSKFGGASALFDGTGDFLTLDGSSAFAFGTGDFTVEMWFRPNSLAADAMLYDGRPTGTSGAYFLVAPVASDSHLHVNINNVDHDMGAHGMSAGNWYHIAVVRSGTTVTAYVNGTALANTFSDSTNIIVGASRPVIGANGFNTASGNVNGWLDDIRVTKGVARYTGSFTPPTIAFPNTDADSDYDSVVMHLPCNGINTSTFFGDTKGHTVTPAGNAQITTAQSKWGGSSATFDGTGDSLNVGFVAMDASDFTLEAWVYFDALGAGNRTLFSQYTGADAARTLLDVRNAKLSIFSGANGVQSGATTLTTGQWYHIAYVRQGTTCKGYLNGVLEVTHSTFQTPYSTNMLVGTYTGASGDEFSGKMDDIRVTRGVARYTAAFTPPAGPFPTTGVDADFDKVTLLLHGEGTNLTTYCEDQAPTTHVLTAVGNAKISDSNVKWGSSCLAFDGTGDYFSIPFSSDFALEAVDFTVEAWIYRSTTGVHTIAQNRPVSGTNGWGFRVYLGNVLDFYYTGGTQVTGVTTVSTGAWHHVAATRSGTTVRLFLDGVLDKTATVSNGTASSSALLVGAFPDGSDCINGYLDDVRITKGLARYTAAFTAPVGAFPDSGLIGVPSANLFTKRLLEGIDLSQRAVPVLPLYL